MFLKILVMGLPGSGKTTISKLLVKKFNAIWINADEVREKFNDWDFSLEGRKRQANRMKELADNALKQNKYVVADFICPTEETRKAFAADYTVWMDTIKKGRFEDTNTMFDPPKKYNFKVTIKDAESYYLKIAEDILINYS